jgi:starch-binding outer membrane protein, SusD/RagB family
MKRIYLKLRKIALVSIFGISVMLLSGCSSFFNPDNDATLSNDDYINSLSELYSGFLGMSAAVQNVADQSIYLEGLRGDLLEPTNNATEEMRDIYNYKDIVNGTTLNGNSLADPKGYYNIILNCNDYIVKATEYKTKNSTAIDDASYKGLVGGAIRYKVWAYMMLAKIYGQAIWVDDPLTSYQDISKYPILSFDDIIAKCIDQMVNGVNGIAGTNVYSLSTLFTHYSAPVEWDRICPCPEILLQELYLWHGDYQKVIDYGLSMITTGGVNGYYLLNMALQGSKWIALAYSFAAREHIFVSYYNYTNNQNNHLVPYFSNLYTNKYYMRPTTVAMNRFYGQVVQTNGSDNMGLGYTFSQVNGDWVLTKYTRNNASSSTYYRSDNIVSLYRASDIYMFMCEALVQQGRFQEAYCLLNGGIDDFINSAASSFKHPFESYPVTMHYDPTSSSWGTNQGIRGRMKMAAVGDSISTTLTKVQLQQKWDSIMVEEAALETAGESRAYYAMIRTAKRWGDAERAMWADKVVAKYPDGGTAIKAKLIADIKNWFIQYKLK